MVLFVKCFVLFEDNKKVIRTRFFILISNEVIEYTKKLYNFS